MDLENIEEVPAQTAMPLPPVEEIIRTAAIAINRFQGDNGVTFTKLQFITPVKVYTFQFDDEGATALSDGIRPSGLVRATTLPK